MTDQAIIRDFLPVAKKFYSSKIGSMLDLLQDGCRCNGSKFNCIEQAVASLNYQVGANLFNGTTESLYQYLLKEVGNYVPPASPITTVINFTQPSNMNVGDPDQTLVANSNSDAQINYASSNTNVATIVNGKLHIVAPGAVVITASQAATTTHTSAYSPKTVTMSAPPIPKRNIFFSFFAEDPYDTIQNKGFNDSLQADPGYTEFSPLFPVEADGDYLAVKYDADQVDMNNFQQLGGLAMGVIPGYEFQGIKTVGLFKYIVSRNPINISPTTRQIRFYHV
jgi:hypothetical protein